MPTPNTATNAALQDAAVRHQIFLQRYGGSSAKRILKLLAEAETDLTRRIAERAAKLAARSTAPEVGTGLVTSARLDSLLAAIREQSRDLREALHGSLRGELVALAETEVDIAGRRLDEALGVDLGNLRPSPEVLRALVDGRIARGETIRRWWTRLSQRRQAALEAAVRLGMVEGDTIRDMTARLRTTERVTRRQAEALVRTATTAVASQSRSALYEANDDVVAEEMWVSTLDSRTSDICIARDGRRWPVGTAHPRPPAHPNCRSTISPVTKTWEELGATNLKPGRGARKFDELFDRRLKEKGFDPAARRQIIAAQRRASMPGSVQLGGRRPTYQQWLKAQPAAFQDEVLGPTKGALFRRGELSVDRFVDERTGRPFTLDELRRRESEAWAKAKLGIDQRDDIQRKSEITAFHATKADFDTFDEALIGTSTDPGDLGRGFYFSTDPAIARADEKTLQVQLNARNPLRVSLPNFQTDKRFVVRDALGLPRNATADDVSLAIRESGFDSVILDYTPAGYKQQEIVVFAKKNIRIIRRTPPRSN